MAEIKEMYKKVVKDRFPDTITIDMGGQTLSYRKKVWSIYDADEKAEVERGLRYGENPDQPAALYELVQRQYRARRRPLLRLRFRAGEQDHARRTSCRWGSTPARST